MTYRAVSHEFAACLTGRALALRSVGEIAGPSHFEQSLNPALPGLPFGISRCFRAMACVSRRRLA
jgi:hypothetical protein